MLEREDHNGHDFRCDLRLESKHWNLEKKKEKKKEEYKTELSGGQRSLDLKCGFKI